MRNLTGEYVKNNKLVPYAVEVPAEWAELDAHQYATIMELLTYQNADRFTISASMVSVLFGPKNWHVLNHLPDEMLHALIPITNFILDTPPVVKNFFPQVKSRKKVYVAPAEDLSNISFAEWCFAYEFFTAYLKYKDKVLLHKLIATLYRPADPAQVPGAADFKGDTRLPFNENLIESIAANFKDIESRFKEAIFGWLTAAFKQVMDARPNVFPEPEKDENGQPKEDAGTLNDARTWLTVFRELLGPKWGTIEQLKVTNAMFVLDGLEEEQIAFNEAKRASAT